jgi:hypothetical protein
MNRICPLLLVAASFARAESVPLFNGRDLDGWESVGDGVWSAMSDGTLLGQRPPGKTQNQAWLYTKQQFGDFALDLEYWLPLDGNSGVSLRDPSRGRFSLPGPGHDDSRTPSHLGYEIQLHNADTSRYPSGSVYLICAAKTGVQRAADWNWLRVEARGETIRVQLNGVPGCDCKSDPARPKTGPIGLQLHGKNGPVMFRNIRIETK